MCFLSVLEVMEQRGTAPNQFGAWNGTYAMVHAALGESSLISCLLRFLRLFLLFVSAPFPSLSCTFFFFPLSSHFPSCPFFVVSSLSLLISALLFPFSRFLHVFFSFSTYLCLHFCRLFLSFSYCLPFPFSLHFLDFSSLSLRICARLPFSRLLCLSLSSSYYILSSVSLCYAV